MAWYLRSSVYTSQICTCAQKVTKIQKNICKISWYNSWMKNSFKCIFSKNHCFSCQLLNIWKDTLNLSIEVTSHKNVTHVILALLKLEDSKMIKILFMKVNDHFNVKFALSILLKLTIYKHALNLSMREKSPLTLDAAYVMLVLVEKIKWNAT